MGERATCCMAQSLSNALHNPLTLSVSISMLVVELIVFLSLDGVSEWLVTFCGDARTEVYRTKSDEIIPKCTHVKNTQFDLDFCVKSLALRTMAYS